MKKGKTNNVCLSILSDPPVCGSAKAAGYCIMKCCLKMMDIYGDPSLFLYLMIYCALTFFNSSDLGHWVVRMLC